MKTQRATHRVRIALATFWLAAAALLGCPGPADPAGPGEACFRALDCQDGLVCIDGHCNGDISSIVPPGAGTPAGGNEAPSGPSDAGP